MRRQPPRLPRQPRRRPARHHPRHHTRHQHRHRRLPGAIATRGVAGGRLRQDRVRVRAAEPERGHPRPPRTLPGRPRHRLGQQAHVSGRPVHVPRRLTRVQRRRQRLMLQGQHHLDHPGHTRRRLGMADVRLHRPQPQRPVPGPVPAVGGQQRLRLDRVTQHRPGPVALHRIHITRAQPRAGQRRPDHPLLRRAVRRRQPVARPVLVHRAARHHRQHRMPVPARLGQPLKQHHARAFAPAGPVRGRGERLAPPIGGQATLPGEFGERARVDHYGDPAGQGQLALS